MHVDYYATLYIICMHWTSTLSAWLWIYTCGVSAAILLIFVVDTTGVYNSIKWIKFQVQSNSISVVGVAMISPSEKAHTQKSVACTETKMLWAIYGQCVGLRVEVLFQWVRNRYF